MTESMDKNPNKSKKYVTNGIILLTVGGLCLVFGMFVQSVIGKSNGNNGQAEQAFLIAHRDKIMTNPGDTVMGNPKGSITLVEFFDYRCGYCKAMEVVVKKAIENEPELRFVLKQFPILSESSVQAARAVLAATAQGGGKDIALHERLMARKGGLNEEDIFADAQAVGLDVKQLRTEMNDKKYSRIIAETAQLAEGLGISGTPGLVIGDAIIRGAIDDDSLELVIGDAKDKLAKAGK